MAAITATAISKSRKTIAQEIRGLTRDIALHSVELGKKLRAARATFKTVKLGGAAYSRPGWLEWAKKETGLGPDMVNKFIRVAEKFPAVGTLKWQISPRVLMLLSGEAVSAETRGAVTERLDQGEKITAAEARDIIARAKTGGITKKEIKKISAFHADNAPPLPKPKVAKKQARDSGEFVLASDGYYYSPATEDQIERHEKSLRLTCKVLRAVETLADMEVTPHEFIDQAVFYMLWTKPGEENAVAEAAKWLNALATVWATAEGGIRQRVVDMREQRKARA
jgi:hypothetical protein